MCTIEAIEESILGTGPRPHSTEKIARVRTGLQRAAYDKLRSHQHINPEESVRQRQRRWNLQPSSHGMDTSHGACRAKTWTPHALARRALNNLHSLVPLTTPRVRAAVFSTMWNRWTTARRFQLRHTDQNKCVLHCSATAEDSIEHYCVCPCVKRVAAGYLHLNPLTQVGLHSFQLCSPFVRSKEELTGTALLVYATYRATNHFRNNPTQSRADVDQALRQWAREGAFGSTFSLRVLDKAWSPNRVQVPLPLSRAWPFQASSHRRTRPYEGQQDLDERPRQRVRHYAPAGSK